MLNKYNKPVKYLYHYTLKENVQSIINDKRINAKNDKYTFFCASLDDSKLLFNNLMCKKIKYIDDNLQVQERKVQSVDDYVILKIKCNNDGDFYTFNYTTTEFNPYNYSIMHLGSLNFDKLEVLPIEEKIKPRNPIKMNIIKGAVAAGIVGTIFTYNINSVFAANKDSWLDDTSYFDISWYNDISVTFDIDNAEKFAGLAYLVNDQGVTFDGKMINVTGNIDMRKYQWETIDASFNGIIEGIHKIILNSDDPQLSSNSTLNGNAIYEETLDSLQISDINITFDENETEYSAEVEYDVKAVSLTCSSTTGDITLSYDGTSEALTNNTVKSINLKEGTNKIELIVKNPNAIEKKYTINVVRKAKVSIVNGTKDNEVTNSIDENVVEVKPVEEVKETVMQKDTTPKTGERTIKNAIVFLEVLVAFSTIGIVLHKRKNKN